MPLKVCKSKYWCILLSVTWGLFSARGGKNVGCVETIHQQNYVTQPRHWPATAAEAWGLEESDHWPRRQRVDSNGQGHRFISAPYLHVEMIRQFRRRLSDWSIVNRLVPAGYWSRCPHWLWMTGCQEGGDGTHRRWNTGGIVSSAMSLTSCCFTVMVMLMCDTGKGEMLGNRYGFSPQTGCIIVSGHAVAFMVTRQWFPYRSQINFPVKKWKICYCALQSAPWCIAIWLGKYIVR